MIPDFELANSSRKNDSAFFLLFIKQLQVHGNITRETKRAAGDKKGNQSPSKE
jgi:hypothetical protein